MVRTKFVLMMVIKAQYYGIIKNKNRKTILLVEHFNNLPNLFMRNQDPTCKIKIKISSSHSIKHSSLSLIHAY